MAKGRMNWFSSVNFVCLFLVLVLRILFVSVVQNKYFVHKWNWKIKKPNSMTCLLYTCTFYCANIHVLLDFGFYVAVPIKHMTIPSWSIQVRRDRVVWLWDLYTRLLLSNSQFHADPSTGPDMANPTLW